MSKLYIIREGFSLRTETSDVFLGGGVIELTDAQYADNAHKLEPVSAERQVAFDADRAAAAHAQAALDAEADARRQAALDADAAFAAQQAKDAKAAAKQG